MLASASKHDSPLRGSIRIEHERRSRAADRTIPRRAQYVAVVPRRDPWAYIGLAAFFALLFVALFGERIAPHQAIFFVPEHDHDPRPYDPGLVFPLGSDILGRDLLSVVLAGGAARVALGLAAAAAAALWRPAR